MESDTTGKVPSHNENLQNWPASLDSYPPSVTNLLTSHSATSQLESASLRLCYVETSVNWLNTFENLVAKKLITALALLISPLVSHHTPSDLWSDKTEVTTRIGYIEGLCLILRQCFEDIRPNMNGKESERINQEFVSLLDKIEYIVQQLHSTAVKVDPILQKMLKSISRYKRKLPDDMSFLDSAIKELKDKSDLSEISLRIWKHWNKMPILQDPPFNLEAHWNSKNPKEILVHSSSSGKSSKNSNLPVSRQSEVICILLKLIYTRVEESFVQLKNIKQNAKDGRSILKTAYNQIHKDEKDCIIPPSSYYVIIKLFDNYTKISATCFKAISSNIGLIKSLVSYGRKCLRNPSSHNKTPLNFHARNIQIIVPIPATTELDALHSEELPPELHTPVRFEYPLSSLQDPKALLTVWLTNTLIKSFSRNKFINRALSDTSWAWNKGISLTSLNDASNNQILISEHNFLQSLRLPILDEEVSSLLSLTLGILKKPNASVNEGVEIDNMSGLVILLASTTANLRYFKEVTASQRKVLEESFNQVQSHLEKLTNPPLHDDIASLLSKLSGSIASLERSLSHAFGIEETSQPLSSPTVESTAKQINKDINTFSDSIADYLAEKNGTYVWHAVCGTDVKSGGIIFRNNTSYEAHSYARLPAFKRIEIIISLLKYIDHILDIAENNVISVIKGTSQVRESVKSATNGLHRTIKNGEVNKLNVESIITSLRFGQHVCQGLAPVSEDIFALLTLVAGVVKDLKSYANLKFKLLQMDLNPKDTLIPMEGRKLPEIYLKEMEKTLMEMKLELHKYPISVPVPLNFAYINSSQ